jgi:hypothetical protein
LSGHRPSTVPPGAAGTRAKAEPRKAFLGVRLSEAELAAWDRENLMTGQTRSEVVRSRLGFTGRKRPRRPLLSDEAAYDYHRAMLISMSVDKICLVLKFVLALEDARNREIALERLIELCLIEAKKIKSEVAALQLRGGICRENPAMSLIDRPLTYLGDGE